MFRDAGKLARAAQILLAASIAIHVVDASYALITGNNVEELSILTPTHCSSAGWLVLIDLPTCVVFCCWWYRVATNLRALQALELTYSPSASVWAFFIPFINIVRPANVGQEIWKASDPALTTNDAFYRRRIPETSLVSTWWTCLVIAGFMRSCTITGAEGVTYTMVAISYVLFAIAGIAAIRLVEDVQRRQNARWRGIIAPASAIPSAELA